VSSLRDDASRTFDRLEHRGETERERAQGDLKRLGRRAPQRTGS
jgi:hypothetical protein